MYSVPGGVRSPRDSPTLPAAGQESTWARKNIVWYDSKPAVCDSSWRTVMAGDLRIGDRGADDVGEALADGLVEPELAGLDELQHDDRRDHLADAGDPEAIAGLDRFGGRGDDRRRRSSVVGRRRARSTTGRMAAGGTVGGGTRKPRSAVCTISPSTATATPTA